MKNLLLTLLFGILLGWMFLLDPDKQTDYYGM
jgi:hypothetical protein